MTTEWKDLPTITDVGKAQADGWEIQRLNTIKPDLWADWDRYSWSSTWKFRGRPRQPKMKKVQLRGFLSPDGYVGRYAEDSISYKTAVAGEWPRIPSEDKEIEVPDDN